MAIKEEYTILVRRFLRLIMDKADAAEIDALKVSMLRIEARSLRIRADLADLAADETAAGDAPTAAPDDSAPVINPTDIDIPDSFGGGL